MKKLIIAGICICNVYYQSNIKFGVSLPMKYNLRQAAAISRRIINRTRK
ncbi:hypothetical protein MuYL_4522 [Mucilaginibacter xinganensis]|uniref:Uncharacterized protein n=1 Tax=Mucilaginibacter xinganensis TaxID=1234841 RepID=A0A223P2R9_9SPHI|nr:hypothetical protein MuYL_4522 [Mucilaginibacter xinganensis]